MSDFKYTKSFEELNAKVRELEQSLTQLTSVISAANQATEEGSVANKKKAKSISDEAVEEKKSAAQKKELKKLEKQLSDLKAKSAALSTEKGKLLSEEIRAQKRLAASKREEINLDKELARLQGSKQSADNLERRVLDVKREKVRLLNQEYRKSITVQAQSEANIKSKGQALDGYNRRLGVTSQMLNQVRGMLLATFGAYAVVRGIQNNINIIKEFESAMARVRAITGASADEMAQLSKIARDVAIKGGIFDPSTVAGLQVELSKLGFTVREIALSTTPIVDLATATGEDLSRAAEVAAATLRSFQLDASEMGRVIDVMAKSFTTSALDMARWAEGAKYAAPIANNLGWSVENLSAIMGVLANRQIFGSLAGTSLRNIMAALADETSDLYKALGLTSSNFDEFIEKLGEANENGLDFGDVLQLIEKRATTSTVILAGATEEIKEMNKAAKNAAGSVKEMADINLQTITSASQGLNATWKSFVTTLDEGSSGFSKFLKILYNGTQAIIASLQIMAEHNVSLDEAIRLYNSMSEAVFRATSVVEGTSEKQMQYINNAIDGLTGEEKKQAELNAMREAGLMSIKSLAIEQRILNNLKDREYQIEQLLFSDKAKDLSGKRIRELANELDVVRGKIAEQSEALQVYDQSMTSYYTKVFNVISRLSKDEVDQFTKDSLERIKILEEQREKIKDDEVAFFMEYYEIRKNAGLVAADQFKKEKEEEIKNRNEANNDALRTENEFLNQLNKSRSTREKEGIADDEKSRKDEYERLKKHLASMRQLEIDQINSISDLTDQQREEELEKIRSRYDRELLLLGEKYEEDAKIRSIYQQRAALELELHEINMQAIRDKYLEVELKNRAKNNERLRSLQRKTAKFDEDLLKLQIDGLRRQMAELDKDDVTGQRSIQEMIFGLEYEKDILEIENKMKDIGNRLLNINNALSEATTDEERSLVLKSFRVTDEEIQELEDQYGMLQILLFQRIDDGIQKLPPLKKTLASLLDIDPRDLNAILSATSAISNALRGAADAAVDAANRKVEASNRAVAELQRDLETELRLAEQGFASNVTLKQQQLAEEKKIRDQNIKEQEKAQKAQLALQSVLDAANMVSTVINIALHTTKTKGLAGILATAVGAASLFALIASIRAKSKAIAETKYEKGGWEVLKGRSHRAGGVSLGDGREAEGGEMLAVFNKKATSKYGKDLGRFIDDVNKGSLKFKPTSINKNSEKINEFTKVINKERIELDTKSVLKASTPQNVIVNFDDRKMVEMNRTLKQIRDNQEYVAGGYKIIKSGGRIRKVKL